MIGIVEGIHYLLKHGLETASKDNILKYPKIFCGLPALITALCALCYLIALAVNSENWQEGLIIVLAIVIPCCVLLVIFSVWRVKVEEEEFEYRNYFGITKRYRYEEIYLDGGLVFRLRKSGEKIFKMPSCIPNDGLLKRRYTKFRLKNEKNKE